MVTLSFYLQTYNLNLSIYLSNSVFGCFAPQNYTKYSQVNTICGIFVAQL